MNRKIFPIVLLASFIFLVPVLHCTLFFDSYLVKLWIVQFGIFILFIYFSWQVLFRQEKIYLNTVTILLLLIYFSINTSSFFLIPSPHKYPALLTLVTLFVYVLLCFFTAQYLADRKTQTVIIFIWILTTIGICVYSIWQYLKNMRVIGTLGNENFLASHIGISIPVCIGYLLQSRQAHKHRSWTRGILLLGLIVLMLFFTTLHLTHARGAWLGLSWSLSSFAIIGWGPKGKRLMISILITLLLIALICTPLGIIFVNAQFQGDVRPAIWEGTLYMITEKPWLGWGKGAYFIFYPEYRVQEYWQTRSPTDLTTHAHNEFLQIFAETGLIGLITFLIFIFIVIRYGIKEIDRIKGPPRHLLLGIISGIIGLLVHNLVCNNLQMPSSAIFLWLMLGMVISYSPVRHFTVNIGRIARRGIFLALTIFMVIIIWQTGIRPLVSQYLFKKGWNLREKGKWDLVIEKYQKAVNWYPWDVEMRYRMAYAYVKNDQCDKAIEEYNNVIDLSPFYGSVHRNMGIVYMKMDEYRLATRSFLQQLQINEYDLVTKVNLSRIREIYGNKPR